MSSPSSALDAALRAIRGESNLNAIVEAFGYRILAQITALAPDAHPVIRFIAALGGALPALLDESDIADPTLHDAVARMIGTSEGRTVLNTWAKIAPAGWGGAHTNALVAPAQRNQCDPGSAAALIGPCNRSAALLHDTRDIAVALRRWGQSIPDAPAAWMNALSAGERDRLIDTVLSAYDGASCIPRLPPDRVNQMRIDHDRLFEALHACVEASPTARARCGELVQRLAAQAHPEHLGPLTRLACAMESDEVWNRVQTMIHKRPSESYRVVAAAPWDALAETARAAILERADSDICTAVAVARGRTIAAHIACESCTAFFAAIDPKVWDALDGDAQRPWLHMLLKHEAHLAVRSRGVRPEILTVARLSNDFIAAALVQRRCCTIGRSERSEAERDCPHGIHAIASFRLTHSCKRSAPYHTHAPDMSPARHRDCIMEGTIDTRSPHATCDAVTYLMGRARLHSVQTRAKDHDNLRRIRSHVFFEARGLARVEPIRLDDLR